MRAADAAVELAKRYGEESHPVEVIALHVIDINPKFQLFSKYGFHYSEYEKAALEEAGKVTEERFSNTPEHAERIQSAEAGTCGKGNKDAAAFGAVALAARGRAGCGLDVERGIGGGDQFGYVDAVAIVGDDLHRPSWQERRGAPVLAIGHRLENPETPPARRRRGQTIEEQITTRRRRREIC